MVWTLEHLPPKFRTSPVFMQNFLQKPEGVSKHADAFRIAIVGGGPKGFYGLERVLEYLPSNLPNLEIHWFNETAHFASGNNYRTDQPEYLLINYNIGNINIWEEKNKAPNRLSLLAWVAKYKQVEREASFTDYASRALVGAYLTDGLSELLTKHSKKAKISLIVGQVTDISRQDEGYRLKIQEGSTMPTYQKILVATGHSQQFNSAQEVLFRKFASSSPDTFFIPKVYPVTPTLTSIPAGQKVGVKGVGLTFIDAVLALTEGKGGEFVRNGTGLTYRPSGREPEKIFAFSRTSLPMLPRGPIDPNKKYKLQLFTPEFVERLVSDKSEDQIDFTDQLEPTIRNEIEFAYYSTLMKRKGFDFPEVKAEDFNLFENSIHEFHQCFPTETPFDFKLFLNPFKGIEFENGTAFHRSIVDYLKYGLNEASQGETTSPLMAAVAVWRELVPVIGKLYAFGGFTPASHQYFDSMFCSPLSRVTFGPPVINMEKIIALAEAGIISFELGPDPKINTPKGKPYFELEGTRYPFKVEVNVLLDARIARPNWKSGSSSFFESVYEKGIARPFSNDGYMPGCFEINRTGQFINQAGEPNKHVFMTGTPTEGITLDNDTLSRKRNNFTEYWAKAVTQSLLKLSVEK